MLLTCFPWAPSVPILDFFKHVVSYLCEDCPAGGEPVGARRYLGLVEQSFVVAEFYFLRAGARAGNWQLWLDRRLTSQLTGQIVWLVNWPVKYNSPRETVRWYPLIKCIFLQYKIIIVNADGNDKPITWIEWTIENINYYKKTKNCPKIDQKLPKMTKNSQKSLTGQRGFDWSNSQLVWLVNDWLTSH